jgi:uncharacterized lipoprotein YehR (DUF1307 family)
MKRLLFVAVAVCLALYSGCKKEDDTKTTFTIVNKGTKFNSGLQYFDGTLWDVIAFCYKGTDVVQQISVGDIAYGGGKSKAIEVNADVEKIKISYQSMSEKSVDFDSEIFTRSYTVSVFYVKKGSNTEIIIDDNTFIKHSLSAIGNSLTVKNSFENDLK